MHKTRFTSRRQAARYWHSQVSDIPQWCKAKIMTFLQLGHQQEIPSISGKKKFHSVSINEWVVWQWCICALLNLHCYIQIVTSIKMEISKLPLCKRMNEGWPKEISSSIIIYSNSGTLYCCTLEHWETNPVEYLCLWMILFRRCQFLLNFFQTLSYCLHFFRQFF